MKWINPDDRLPARDERVLFAMPETWDEIGEVHAGIFVHREYFRNDDQDVRAEPNEITAWMPWPVAPNSREEMG